MSELYHHGVKGQRWGVRRYQNADGSLTEEGEKRFQKVANSRHKTKKNKKAAIEFFSEHSKRHDVVAKQAESNQKRAYKKMDKYVWKSEAKQKKGDTAGFEKWQGKAWQQMAKQIEENRIAQFNKIRKEAYDKKISEIKDETIKAGKDYIAKYSEFYYVIPGPGVSAFGKYEDKYFIERKK